MAGAFEISSSEARRLIRQGGVKLDGEPVAAETLDLRARRARRPGPAGRQAPLPPPACAGSRRRQLASAGRQLLYRARPSWGSCLGGRPCVKSGESRRRGAAVFEN